jgi:hypothetical protein
MVAHAFGPQGPHDPCSRASDEHEGEHAGNEEEPFHRAVTISCPSLMPWGTTRAHASIAQK